MPPLPFKEGKFNSIEIDGTSLSPSEPPSSFTARLSAACDAWRAAGRGAVWLPLSLTQGQLISAAAASGFTFHHAEGSVAMMHAWLQPRASPVPPYATHHVGVGGVLVDDQDNLLLVREPGRKVGWKFPGGLADLGEDFATTAIREVFEETGVRSVFRSVLALRHQHNTAFGRSDIFVMCRLALAEGASRGDIKMDTNEIEACDWMPAAAFMAQSTHPLNTYAARLAVMEARAERAYRSRGAATAASPLPDAAAPVHADCVPTQDELMAFAASKEVGEGVVCERVYIAGTKRLVKVYHGAARHVYDHSEGLQQLDAVRRGSA